MYVTCISHDRVYMRQIQSESGRAQMHTSTHLRSYMRPFKNTGRAEVVEVAAWCVRRAPTLYFTREKNSVNAVAGFRADALFALAELEARGERLVSFCFSLLSCADSARWGRYDDHARPPLKRTASLIFGLFSPRSTRRDSYSVYRLKFSGSFDQLSISGD